MNIFKRFFASILTLALLVTSVQLPMNTAAEESSNSTIISADDIFPEGTIINMDGYDTGASDVASDVASDEVTTDNELVTDEIKLPESNYEDSNLCGETVNWSIENNDGASELVIYGIGAMYDYDSVEDVPWNNSGMGYVKSVKIMSNITHIGSCFFSRCTSLESVTIGEDVTSIASNAFVDCTKIKTVFNKSSLDIVKGATTNGYVAYYADNVYKVCADGEHTGGTATCTSKAVCTTCHTEYGSFASHNMASDTCTACNASIVESGTCGEDVYWYITDDYELVVYGTGAMNTPIRPTYGYVYDTLPIQKARIEYGVTSVCDYAFSYMDFETIEIADSVQSFGMCAFESCRNLKSITIPNGVTSISSAMFGYCESLSYVSIPDSVQSICENAFYDCISLSYIKLPDGIENISVCAFYNCNSLFYIEFPSGVKDIGSGAFENCASLIYVALPDTLEYISDYAFNNCYALSKVLNLSSLDIQKGSDTHGYVAYYAEHVYTCLPCEDGAHTGGIATATSGALCEICGREYGDYNPNILAFGMINDNISWIVDNEYTMTVSGSGEIPDEFMYSSSYVDPEILNYYELIEKIVIEDGITSSGVSSFSGLRGLTSVEIAGTVKNIGNHTFDGNDKLSSVILHDGVETIGEGAFYYCSSLQTIELPDSITTIGSGAFSCTGLTSIDIPKNVTYIGDGAFYCGDLVTVYNESTLDIVKGSDTYGGVALFAKNVYNCPKCEGGAHTGGEATSLAKAQCEVCYREYGDINPDNPVRGKCGDDVSWYITSNYELFIHGSGDMYDFDDTNLPTWNEYSKKIKRVVVEEGVTGLGANSFIGLTGISTVELPKGLNRIDSYDFQNCTMITNLVIPEGVTEIGTSAFYGCTKLASIELPNTLLTIGYAAFSNCNKIVSIDIPEGVTEIGTSAFYGCTELASVELPNTLLTIGYAAFSNCNKIVSVDIPGSVTVIGAYAFNNCSKLESITLNTGLKEIGDYAFQMCTKLTSIDIPNGAASIGQHAFEFCSGFSTIELPDSVSYIGDNAFAECTNLTSIKLPSVLTAVNNRTFFNCAKLDRIEFPVGLLTIGDEAFYNCILFESIKLPKYLSSIGTEAFYGCSELKTIYNLSGLALEMGSEAYGYVAYYAFNLYDELNFNIVDDGNCGEFAFWYLTDKNELVIYGDGDMYDEYYTDSYTEYPWLKHKSIIKKIIIQDGITNIATGAFEGCACLISVDIADSVVAIGSTAFASCSSLTSITIPDGIEMICPYTFARCSQLSSIQFPDTLKSIESAAFVYCTSLTYLSIPDSVTSIGAEAFACCTSLTYVEVPGSVQELPDDMFMCCDNLKNVKLGNGIKRIGRIFGLCTGLEYVEIPSTVEYMGETFNGCTSLKTVKLYNGLLEIDTYAFTGCTELTSIEIPGSLKVIPANLFNGIEGLESVKILDGVTTIEDNAFYNCVSLALLEIPDSVESIGNCAFALCSSLQSVELPENLTYLGESAFALCSSLSSINIPDTLNSIAPNTFYSCSELAEILIPSSVTAIYNSAFNKCTSLKFVDNYSTLDIVKGETTHGYVAYYADKVYGAPCAEGTHVGGTATCISQAICTECNRKYGDINHNNHVGETELRDVVTKTCTIDGHTGNLYCTSCEVILQYGDILVAPGHAFADGNCTRCGSVSIIDNGNCGDSLKWMLTKEGSLVIYGTDDMTQYSTCSDVPWYTYRNIITSITVEPLVGKLSPYAFYGLSNVVSVQLNKRITEIPAYAFYECDSLTRFDIPAQISSVGENAFGNCDLLENIYFAGKAPATVGQNVFGSTSSSTIYYYANVAGWASSIVNDRWNGYFAIPRNAITEDIPSVKDMYVIKVVDMKNLPIVGATVVLDDVTVVTDSRGMAYYRRPSTSVSLSISRDLFHSIDYSNFTPTNVGFIEYIELSDAPYSVRAVSCNGKTITSNVMTVNCFGEGTFEVTVVGRCARGIEGYTIMQDNRVLVSVKTNAVRYTFNIDNNLVEEGGKIYVIMTTAEGDEIVETLNFDVIKMTTTVSGSFARFLDVVHLNLPYIGELNFEIKDIDGLEIFKEIDGRTIKIGINIDENLISGDEDEFKKRFEKELSKWGQKMKGKPGMNITIKGYVELYYAGNGQFRIVSDFVKVVFACSVKGSAGASFYGLVGVRIEISLTASFELNIVISGFEEGEIILEDLSTDISLELKIKGSVYILWGFGSAYIYGSGTAGAVLEIYPDFGIESIYLKGELGVGWSIMWGWYKGERKLLEGTWAAYERNPSSAMFTSELRRAMRDPNYNSMNARDYLQDRSEWLSGSGISAFSLIEDYYDLQTSVYSEVAPKIVHCNGTTMMVWLDDNAERLEDNFQTLYYSVFDYDTLTWSAPKQVDTNNTFDCEFDVFTDGNDIYVIYTEQTSEMTGVGEMDISNIEDIKKLINGVEVKVLKYNGAGFDAPVILTDNAICETMPVITTRNGVITALWATKTADDKDNLIYFSQLVDGVWTAVKPIAEHQNEITSVNSGLIGSEYVYAYAVDSDGSVDTSDDIALIIVDSEGNSMQIDSGYITDIKFDYVDGVPTMFWYNNGNFYYTSAVDGTIYSVLTAEYSDCKNYRLVTTPDGRTLLTFTSSTSDGSDIFGIYITGTGVCGLPVQLTDVGGYIDNYDIELIDDTLLITFTETIAVIEGENIDTTTDFRYALLDLSDNLTLNSIFYSDTSVKSGETFEIEAELTNNGFNDISAVTAIIKDADGNVVFEDIYEILIRSGETASITISAIAPIDIRNDMYTLSIVPCELVDANIDDNETAIRLGVANLKVVAAQTIIGNNNFVSVEVKNYGNITTNAVLTICGSDGSVIAEIEIENIRANESRQYLVDVNSITDDENITLTVSSTEQEAYENDNKTVLFIMVVKPEEIVSAVTSPIQQNPELDRTTIEYDKYTDRDLVITITSGIDNFTGIVDLEKGNHYVVDGNNVTIYEFYLDMLDNNYVHDFNFVFDFGNGNVVTRNVAVSVSDSSPIILSGSVSISGDVVAGNTVTADISGIKTAGATVIYIWTVDGTVVSETESYTLKSDDFGKVLKLTVTGTGSYMGELNVQEYIDMPVIPVPVAPVVAKKGTNSIEFVYVPNVEYSIDGVNWQSSNVFDNLNENTTYLAFARNVSSGFVGEASAPAIIKTKSAIEGSISISGIADTGSVLSVDTSALTVGNLENLTFQWYRDSVAINGATGSTYTVTKDDMGKQLSVIVTGTGDYTGTLESSSITVNSYVLGDVDGNTRVTLYDVMTIVQAINQKIILKETQKLAADLDHNGRITVYDLMKLVQFINKNISTLE